MPRPPRLHVPGGYYHVVVRGNHREPLFGSDPDRLVLDDITADALAFAGARLHAYCWMTNHLHALIQPGDRPLGDLMHRIAMRYSRFRHRAMATVGHLFERRYRAKLIDVDRYFLAVLRYVHMNPVKAGMVPDPALYRWSSHHDYLGQVCRTWVTTDIGLSMLSSERSRAHTAYAAFMRTPDVGESFDPEAMTSETDQPVGSEGNVGPAAGMVRAPPGEKSSLADLAESVCIRHGVALATVRSRASLRCLTPIRIEIAQAALERDAASLTEVAQFLGRDLSTLCQMLKRHRRNPQ